MATIAGKALKFLFGLSPIGKILGGSNILTNGSSMIKDLFKTGAVGNFVKGVSGSGLTQAQIEQNQWSSDEAQKSFDRELEADSTKYQRQTADMMAAGLNPAVMYGNSISSAGSVSSSPASGSPESNVSAGILDSLLSVVFAKQRMENLKEEGNVLRSQSRYYNSQADLLGSEKTLKDLAIEYYPKLQDKNLEHIQAAIDRIYSQNNVDISTINLQDADAALKDSQRILNEIDADWRDRLNAAKQKGDLAAAAKAYADAAWQRYLTQFAKEHGGTTPGYNQILGISSAIAGSLSDMGMNSVDLDNLDWIDIMWPWFSFFRKKNKN